MSDSAIVKHIHNGMTRYVGSIGSYGVTATTKFSDLEQFTNQPIGTREKTLTALRLELGEESLETVGIYVGVKQRLKDAPTWFGPFSLADGDDMLHVVGLIEDARFFAFKIEDLFPRSVWGITALEFYGEVGEGRE